MSTDLSDRLRKAREDANLTQDAAAEALGVGRTRIAEWETGVHRPRAETLARLADVYGVPVGGLLGREPGNRTAAAPTAPSATGSTVAIPATTLAFWRGTIESEIRHLSGVSETLLGIKRMLDDATNGIGGVLTSGVFQPVEHVRAPSVEDIVASWTPAEIQRAFAVIEEANESRATLDARLAQQPPSDRAPAAAQTPPPPAEAASARRRRTG